MAGAGIKEIKTRINSVITKQVTKTMELVASSKWEKQRQALAARPYFGTCTIRLKI